MNNLDSDPDAGTPSTPIGGSSGGTGDSDGSVDAKALQTAYEALKKRLDEVDARSKALQGDKDRGVKQTRTELDELRRKVAEIEKLKKSGYDEDAAFEELGFREDVRAVKSQLSKLDPVQPQPAGNGAGAAVNKAEVIKQYGLDGNDPDVITKFLSQDYNSPAEAELVALRIAYQKNTSPPPSPAAAPALTGKSPVKEGLEELTKNYQKDMLANRGNKSALIAIKEKAKKDGVPVDSIVFT